MVTDNKYGIIEQKQTPISSIKETPKKKGKQTLVIPILPQRAHLMIPIMPTPQTETYEIQIPVKTGAFPELDTYCKKLRVKLNTP